MLNLAVLCPYQKYVAPTEVVYFALRAVLFSAESSGHLS